MLPADWRNIVEPPPVTASQWSDKVLLVDPEGKQWVDCLFYDGAGKPLLWLSRRQDATHWLPLPVPPIRKVKKKIKILGR